MARLVVNCIATGVLLAHCGSAEGFYWVRAEFLPLVNQAQVLLQPLRLGLAVSVSKSRITISFWIWLLKCRQTAEM